METAIWKVEVTVNDMDEIKAIPVWVFVRAEREYQAKNKAFRKVKRFYPGRRYQVVIENVEDLSVEVII